MHNYVERPLLKNGQSMVTLPSNDRDKYFMDQQATCNMAPAPMMRKRSEALLGTMSPPSREMYNDFSASREQFYKEDNVG